MTMSTFCHAAKRYLALVVVVVVATLLGRTSGVSAKTATLAVHITSPLGRTGFAGPIRIVAQVHHRENVRLQGVKIFVDEKLLGETKDGPPFAIEWTDDNPFEAREISAEACDEIGECARDVVHLDPLTVTEDTGVSSVLLEASVRDAAGRQVTGLTVDDFRITEDDVPQIVDQARAENLDSTYTLLIDCSQSMSRRIDFVQEAAARLVGHLRPGDRVIVAPFTRTLGAITGPTTDRQTVISAIASTNAGGGTAVVDALSAVPKLLEGASGRQAVVLITDGYDEHSTHSVEDALRAMKAAQGTLFVIGVGGIAGISIKGERALRALADQTGGRAFFPSREEELPRIHDLIVADVQQRYLLAYTPTNQRIDGGWRRIGLFAKDSGYSIRTRPGYFAPKPPPVRATLEFVAANQDKQPVQISAAELSVFEDGVPQTLDTFHEAVAPISIVLAIDASGSMKPAADAVREAATSFVHALRPNDQLALVVFSDEAVMVHDLTTNRQWTLAGIDQYKPTGGTALNDAVQYALERLQSAEGRRALVLLTDGRDENARGTAAGSTHSLAEVLQRVHDVDVTIYAIGLGPNVDVGTLDRMATLSGGESFFPPSAAELNDEYRRVIDHLRQRYVISYLSSNAARDGGWRRVDIRSVDPHVQISSRGGYSAPVQ
jgi:VWFA-related protein